MSKTFAALAVAVSGLLAGVCLQVTSLAAASPQAGATPLAQKTSTAAAVPSRELLEKYCIGCHNDRLKTAGLSLEKVDPGDVAGHAEVLEKVVRKLRTGTMPPEGRPHPDKAAADQFAASLETALDRLGQMSPNPGRVASHRLNRAEYVNVIRDLLALDINGTEFLPSDMAGFGFDNNADVLSITPSLMS